MRIRKHNNEGRNFVKKNRFAAVLFALLAIASMSFIFYNSSLNAEESTEFSRDITAVLFDFFAKQNDDSPADQPKLQPDSNSTDGIVSDTGLSSENSSEHSSEQSEPSVPTGIEIGGNIDNDIEANDISNATTPIVSNRNEEVEEKPAKEYSPDVLQKNGAVRRAAHAVEFIPLGFSIFGFIVCILKRKKHVRFAALYSLFACVLYALFDEIHQIFIDGRACEFSDGLMDTFGSLVGIVVCMGFLFVWRKFRAAQKTTSE